MWRKSFFFGLLLISMLGYGQPRERFPELIEAHVTGLPLIKGYSESDSAKHLYTALEAYLKAELTALAKEQNSLLIGGSGQFIIVVDHNQVTDVEIVTANSLIFARQIEGLLHAIPIEENSPEDAHWVIPIALNQLVGCCVNSNYTYESLETTVEASEYLTHSFHQVNMHLPDSLRWAVRSNSSGKLECLVMTEHSPREWNDYLIENLEAISAHLPRRKGVWLIGYYPRKYREPREASQTE